MTIPLIKPIAIIILVCLFLKGLGICDLSIWIHEMYKKRVDKKKTEYEIVIGEYNERENKNNRTFLVGKGDMRGKEE